ncbi:uncharacterized protein LOC127705950 [Mytilus californianus]|uniref:uncharacterized protein LOC127705950 n=1 Tax=Mytilus californianus TaxID=6549 RepID=UPI002245BA4A|nr:uncharacterized protein LOC127705950 [Mytilus californianus]
MDMAHNFILLLQITVLLCVLVDSTSAHGADEANPCTSSHCQNGGTCRPDGQSFRCDCHEGYGGDFCNLDQPVTQHRVVIGDNVRLACYTNRSLPRPVDVEWFKSVDGNNTRVNLTADVSKYGGGTISKRSLTIYRTNFDDTADYSCRTNNTAHVVNQEFHHVSVEGVKHECSSMNENLVRLNYIGVAVEVVFTDQTNAECPFLPVDDKFDNFKLTVGLGNVNSTSNVSNECNFTKTSEDYFSGRVIVRRTMKGFDTTTDFALDVYCSYVVTTNSMAQITTESKKLSAPVLQSQPSGPKSESSYSVEVRDYRGRPLRNPRQKSPVIFQAVMTPAGNNTAFTVSSCKIFTDDKKKIRNVLTNGCGTGFPFKVTEGFTMRGTIGKSPIFKLFTLKRRHRLNIACNFFECEGNCDGSSCKKT